MFKIETLKVYEAYEYTKSLQRRDLTNCYTMIKRGSTLTNA